MRKNRFFEITRYGGVRGNSVYFTSPFRITLYIVQIIAWVGAVMLGIMLIFTSPKFLVTIYEKSLFWSGAALGSALFSHLCYFIQEKIINDVYMSDYTAKETERLDDAKLDWTCENNVSTLNGFGKTVGLFLSSVGGFPEPRLDEDRTKSFEKSLNRGLPQWLCGLNIIRFWDWSNTTARQKVVSFIANDDLARAFRCLSADVKCLFVIHQLSYNQLLICVFARKYGDIWRNPDSLCEDSCIWHDVGTAYRINDGNTDIDFQLLMKDVLGELNVKSYIETQVEKFHSPSRTASEAEPPLAPTDPPKGTPVGSG